MKLSNGFERVVPSIFVFVSYLLCFTCLTYAMKFWQVSTAYALWSGLGTALTAVIGYVLRRDAIATPGGAASKQCAT
jgi:small multidrug resistance pump